MPKVKFIEVGRNKLNWEAICMGPITYEWLCGQAKNIVMSSDIDFFDNGEIIVGGFRVVGRFEIIETEAN